MGLLDNLAGKASGGGAQDMLSALMNLLGNSKSGGISGLVQQFSNKGLGDIANSWVGKGENLPISAQQIEQGFGSDTISQLASKTGISSGQITSQLSELLPKFVDKLTPNGKVEQGDFMSQGMDLLKGFMK